MAATISTDQVKNNERLNNGMDYINKDILSLSAFLKRRYPKCIPVPLNKGTKTPIKGFEFAKDKINNEDMWKAWDTIGIELVANGDCDVGISIRGDWVVVDVDNMALADAMLTNEGFKDTVSVRTKKGIHFYFEKTDECQDWINTVKPFVADGIVQDIDIISTWANGTGGLITFPPSTDKTWIKKMGENEILPMPERMIEYAKNHWKVKETIRPNNFETTVANYDKNEAADREYVQSLCRLLSKDRADNYMDWIKVGWCLRNIDYRFLPIWIEFSKKSFKFSRGECEMKWDYFKAEGGFKLGSLCMWAKADNPDGYSELHQEKLRKLVNEAKSGTEYDVALVIKEMFGDQYVYAPENEVWYVFENHKWVLDNGALDLKQKLPTVVADHFRISSAFFQARAARPDTSADDKDRLDDIVKKLMEVVSKLKRAAFQSSVITECCMLFKENKFVEKLNEKHHLIGFENGVFDLDAWEFRYGRPDDYITLTTGYTYNPLINDCVRADIMKFMHDIQENPEIEIYLLDTLATNLHGTKWDQWLHFWNGKGGNGKSLLMILFAGALGQLHFSPPIEVFTTAKKSGSGANPEIVKAKGMRGISSNEPAEGATLQINLLKEWSGGEKIYGRGLYQDGIEFKLQGGIFLLMNNKPSVQSCDGGFERRLRNVYFPFQFKEEENLAKNIKKADKELNKKFNDPVYHQQFMLILLERFKLYKDNGYSHHTPQRVLDDTKTYLNESNYVLNFIDETYDRVDSTNENPKFVCSSDLWTYYQMWAKDQDKEARYLKRGVFNERMKMELDLPIVKKTSTKGGSHNSMVVFGLKVKCNVQEGDDYDY